MRHPAAERQDATLRPSCYDGTRPKDVTVDERDCLAEPFEEHRGHLRAVAYRMLGSLSDADDAVQEAWLRLSRADTSGVANLGGWLTTVVGRVCLDVLRSRVSRREGGGPPPSPGADLPRQRDVVDAFLAASRRGDFAALLAVLDPEIVVRA